MKFRVKLIISLFFFCLSMNGFSQVVEDMEKKIVDIVWLKDGSKLTGTILKWELERGMEFQLLTGAVIVIPKAEINRVMQDTPYVSDDRGRREPYFREPRVYAFKEEGWYHNTSGFINFSFMGGAGIHHAMGFRFNRLLGIGLGTGIETHDFNNVRNIIPVYAEVRGFFFPKKITPYYAVKLGYGFALTDELAGTSEAKGGIHFSPEMGVRFGGRDVTYYAGLEYKIQNATFTSSDFIFGGGVFTEKISYRRLELRTGLLF